MLCTCGSDTGVIDSRKTLDGTRRRRKCLKRECGSRFTTIEKGIDTLSDSPIHKRHANPPAITDLSPRGLLTQKIVEKIKESVFPEERPYLFNAIQTCLIFLESEGLTLPVREKVLPVVGRNGFTDIDDIMCA